MVSGESIIQSPTKQDIADSFLCHFEGWFAYTEQAQPFELRSTKLEVGTENKYQALVGYDPEGYFMEFDKFHAHPTNKQLIEYLKTGK